MPADYQLGPLKRPVWASAPVPGLGPGMMGPKMVALQDAAVKMRPLGEALQTVAVVVNTVLDWTPLIGDIKAGIEAAVGENLLGDKLSAGERALAVATILPFGDFLRLGKYADDFADVVGEGGKHADEVGDASKTGRHLDGGGGGGRHADDGGGGHGGGGGAHGGDGGGSGGGGPRAGEPLVEKGRFDYDPDVILNKKFRPEVWSGHNPHLFQIDPEGRVHMAEAQLMSLDNVRNQGAQRATSGGWDGIDATHVVSRSLGGPGGPENLVRLPAGVNREEIRAMERTLEDAMKKDPGKQLYMRALAEYTSDRKIPDSITYVVYEKLADGSQRVFQEPKTFVGLH
jgi:hypothetical protein